MKQFLQKERRFVLAVLVLHLAWFIISIAIGDRHTGDSDEYEQQALNIKEHGSLYAWYWTRPVDNDYHTWRPPVYGSFIFFSKLVSSSDYFFIFLQNLFSMANCVLLLYQCLRLPLNFNPRWWILAATAFFPSWFMIANSISADTIFLFWLILAFTCLQEFLVSGRPSYFMLYNGLLILALFTKPVLLYFWIPNLLFCIYLYRQKKKRILLFLPLLFPVLVTAWCARNQYVTGYWHFSSVSHINLVYYNANYPLMRRFGNDYADSVSARIRREAKTKRSYAEQAKYTEQQSLAIIRQYPGDYVYWHLKGILLLFLEPGRSDWIHYFKMPPADNGSFSIALDERGWKGFFRYAEQFSLPMLLLMAVLGIWNLALLILSVYGFWRARKNTYIQFLFIFFLYISVLTGVVGCARYRLTIYPVMIIAALLSIKTKGTNRQHTTE